VSILTTVPPQNDTNIHEYITGHQASGWLKSKLFSKGYFSCMCHIKDPSYLAICYYSHRTCYIHSDIWSINKMVCWRPKNTEQLSQLEKCVIHSQIGYQCN